MQIKTTGCTGGFVMLFCIQKANPSLRFAFSYSRFMYTIKKNNVRMLTIFFHAKITAFSFLHI